MPKQFAPVMSSCAVQVFRYSAVFAKHIEKGETHPIDSALRPHYTQDKASYHHSWLQVFTIQGKEKMPMKRIDLVQRELEKLPPGEQVTTAQLSAALGISRANASSDLNTLCKLGLAEKTGSKPVYYSLAAGAPRQNEFDEFLQQNQSLFHCGEQAKAAVLYPPHGMHIFLSGETGVGKTMFAELVFHYALSQGRMQSPNAFVSFNCADYANNPQLLLSQLFGVKKGAYTGAETDRDGLLHRANGGMLFLDEVHRLPPEGQEILFTFIDRGLFRRMGETATEQTAQVMLVCATTEDPTSTLLQTFVRRIPMVISIPSLAERGIEERLHLINDFFTAESQRLGLGIQVSVNSMRALLGYHCPGNIGQLKSDIQLLCARAYSEYVAGKKDTVSISSFALPPDVRSGLFERKNWDEIWSLLSGINRRFIDFDAHSQALPLEYQGKERNIYQVIDQRMEDMRRIGIKEEQVQQEIASILARYYQSYEGTHTPQNYPTAEYLVPPEVSATVDKLLLHASGRLNRSFGDNVRYGLSLHVYQTIQRVRQGKDIVNPSLAEIREKFPAIFSTAQECAHIIERDFSVTLPPDEAGFIAMFLHSDQLRISERPMVEVVVLMHGAGVATGMAETANRLVGTAVVAGVDVPLDESPETVYLQLKHGIAAKGNVREVLLLVDMGSLVNFADDLGRDLGLHCRALSLASTLHAIEAGRKASLGYPLRDVLEAAYKVNELALPQNNAPIPTQGKPRLCILCVCTTGQGGARVLQQHLEARLNLYDGLCTVIPLQVTDKAEFENKVHKLGENSKIISVAGSFSTNLPVPHFGMADLFEGSALSSLQDVVNAEAGFLQVEKSLIPLLENIDGPAAAQDIRNTMERIEKGISRQLDKEMQVGVFCHVGCMLDRLTAGQPVALFPEAEEMMARYPKEILLIRKECERLARRYRVEIPNDEICYLAAFYTKTDLF